MSESVTVSNEEKYYSAILNLGIKKDDLDRKIEEVSRSNPSASREQILYSLYPYYKSAIEFNRTSGRRRAKLFRGFFFGVGKLTDFDEMRVAKTKMLEENGATLEELIADGRKNINGEYLSAPRNERDAPRVIADTDGNLLRHSYSRRLYGVFQPIDDEGNAIGDLQLAYVDVRDKAAQTAVNAVKPMTVIETYFHDRTPQNSNALILRVSKDKRAGTVTVFRPVSTDKTVSDLEELLQSSVKITPLEDILTQVEDKDDASNLGFIYTVGYVKNIATQLNKFGKRTMYIVPSPIIPGEEGDTVVEEELRVNLHKDIEITGGNNSKVLVGGTVFIGGLSSEDADEYIALDADVAYFFEEGRTPVVRRREARETEVVEDDFELTWVDEDSSEG